MGTERGRPRRRWTDKDWSRRIVAGLYKDCQRQKLVENVDGCRSSAMKRTRVEEEMKWLIMCSLKYNYEIK